MTPSLRFSQLSSARQALIRACQAINCGQIQDLYVRDREPVFTPAPTLPVDVKLDQDETPRTEVQLADFEVADEVRRLLLQLDERKDWVMDKIEVRGGLPRRIVFAVPLPGGVAPSVNRAANAKEEMAKESRPG
jgi:hypothetical protein